MMAKLSTRRLGYSLLSLTSLLSASVNATCYEPGYGMVHQADGFSACTNTLPSSSGVRICCTPGDTCSQDGLCRGGNATSYVYYNAGCTDPNYSDPLCRKTCIGYAAIYVAWNPTAKQWACCGNSGSCDGSLPGPTFNAVSPDNYPLIGSPSSSSASSSNNNNVASSTSVSTSTTGSSRVTSTGAVTSSSTGAAASSNSAAAASAAATSNASTTEAPSSGGLSTGAQAGIGVGIALAVLLLAALGAAFYFRRRKQNRAHLPLTQDAQGFYSDKEKPVPSAAGPAAPKYMGHELSTERAPVEMDATTTYELPPSNYR